MKSIEIDISDLLGLQFHKDEAVVVHTIPPGSELIYISDMDDIHRTGKLRIDYIEPGDEDILTIKVGVN